MQKKTILVVDDQKANRDILVQMLKPEYDTVEADNGKTALDIINQNREGIAAIMLDLIMPVMDGYELLQNMAHDEILSNIPVLVTTDNDDEQSELRVLSLGASDFVYKPFRMEIIKHRVRNLIKLREARAAVDILGRDELTGILNREAFYHKVEEVLSEEEKKPGSHVIIAVDIERFKLVNEMLGVSEGDLLLKHVADILNAQTVDCGGVCARINSDVFMVLGLNDEQKIQKVILNVNRELEKGASKVKINLKYGIFVVDDYSVPVVSMCDRALLTVNSIKGQIGCNYSYYDESLREKLLLDQQIAEELTNIPLEQLYVYFQPKFELSSGKLAGAEALVRWNHPQHGIMSLGKYIGFFEDSGFITQLDEHVWDKTCEKVEEWKQQGLPVVPVSVNVSRRDIYNIDLPKTLMDTINRHGLKPENIHLEITETAYTENSYQLIEVVNELKNLGFIIEMDDFGSGYSSLNMLSELPIDILKLDMNFIASNGRNDKNIMSFVIGLAKWMNLQVVAEGVETKDQADMLKSMNCNFVQGYLYGRPMPDADFTSIIENTEVSYAMNSPADNDSSDHKGQDAIKISGDNDAAKIMIVDDSEVNRKSLADIFRNDFKIIEASNGNIAVDYMSKKNNFVDLIILNLVMSEMNGYQVLETIKGTDHLKNIPVIVTSYEKGSNVEKAMKLGADACISKPYEVDEVVGIVQKTLEMGFQQARVK